MSSPMPVQADAWAPADAGIPSAALSPLSSSSGASKAQNRPIPQTQPIFQRLPARRLHVHGHASVPVPRGGPFQEALPPRAAVGVTGNGLAIRALDIVGASVALILLFPVMLLTALAIMILDPGPLLFGHTRVGKGGRPFQCLKFRSMTVDADARLVHLLKTDPAARAEWQETQKLRRDPRITPIGRFLRRSCLDELPQFFNVLRGDMSLVGPRPIVAGEAVRYGRHYPVYCSLKPGSPDCGK